MRRSTTKTTQSALFRLLSLLPVVCINCGAQSLLVSGWIPPPSVPPSSVVITRSLHSSTKSTQVYNNDNTLRKLSKTTRLFMKPKQKISSSNKQQQQSLIVEYKSFSSITTKFLTSFALLLLPTYLLFFHDVPYVLLSNLASTFSSSKLLYDVAAYSSTAFLSPLASALLFCSVFSAVYSLASSLKNGRKEEGEILDMTPLTDLETKKIMNVVGDTGGGQLESGSLLRNELEEVQKLVKWAEKEE